MPGSNGPPIESPRDGPDEPTDPLAEAETMRALFQDGVVGVRRLTTALRHQRKQTLALHTTLTPLRRLQHLDS